MNRKGIDWESVLFLGIVGIGILLAVGPTGLGIWWTNQANWPIEADIIITVGRKEYADNTYLVFTKHEVFRVEDTLRHRRFDSSDMYNRIAEGTTYRITVAGHRRPFWGMYRNILVLERVAE